MPAVELEAEALIIFRTQEKLHDRASQALKWRKKYQLEGQDKRVDWANRVYQKRIGQISTTIEALGTIRAAYEQAGIRRTTREDLLQIAQDLPQRPSLGSTSLNGHEQETNQTAASFADLAVTQKSIQSVDTAGSEDTDPLAQFKAKLDGEPDWRMTHSKLTQKMPSGRFPFGIRPARMVLAAVAYNGDLERINPTLSAAIREAYEDILILPDGSRKEVGAIFPNAKRAIDDFFENYFPRKGRRLSSLPLEIQEAISRIKTDPILNGLSLKTLRLYSSYAIGLQEALLGNTVTNISDVVGKPRNIEKRNREKKQPRKELRELAGYQFKVAAEYLRIVAENGWQGDNMARHVALSLHRDEIPNLGQVPEMVREEVIKRKVGSVIREKSRTEKKLRAAIELEGQGKELFGSLSRLNDLGRKYLKIEDISLEEISDLIHNRVSLDELKKKHGIFQKNQSNGISSLANPAHVSKETAEINEITDSEIMAVYLLLDVFTGQEEIEGNKGLRYQTPEEAFNSIHKDEIMSLPPDERVTYIISGQIKFLQDAKTGFAKLEKGKAQKNRGQFPGDQIDGLLNWLEAQTVGGFKVYENRDIQTLRRVALREIDLSRFIPKGSNSSANRNSRKFVTG